MRNSLRISVGISFACLALLGCGSSAPATVTAPITTAPAGACVPISQSIPFSGSALQLDASNNLYGGIVPGSSTPYGSMIVGSGAPVNGTNFTSSSFQYGNFQINVLPASQVPGTATTATVSGSLMIGQSMQQTIQSASASGSGGYGTSATPCVSGIAVQGHLYSTGSYGYGGKVYIYINNTTHGETLMFQ
ncbi:MAG: hypothetical protein ACXWP5_08175 [Bdellovibrionota bacterium]